MTHALELTDAGSSVVDRTPELSEHAVEPQTRTASLSRRVVPRRVRMSSRETLERRLADRDVEPARVVMPRVATIEYPEDTVQFGTDAPRDERDVRRDAATCGRR